MYGFFRKLLRLSSLTKPCVRGIMTRTTIVSESLQGKLAESECLYGTKWGLIDAAAHSKPQLNVLF